MKCHAACLVISLVAACATPPPAVAPAAPPAPPPPPTVVAPPITSINAGGLPGGTPHMWGSRAFDLRVVGDHTEFRLHDVFSFQGVGMTPDQMSPPTHVCTPWETLPADVAASTPAGAKSCYEPRGSCDAINAWLAPRATSPATTDPDFSPRSAQRFGRAEAPCA